MPRLNLACNSSWPMLCLIALLWIACHWSGDSYRPRLLSLEANAQAAPQTPVKQGDRP